MVISCNCEIGRITGPEVFYVSGWENFLLLNLEEALWEPLAMTFDFLSEGFSLKGTRGRNRVLQKETGPTGHLPRLVPTPPGVSLPISLCFSVFFQLLASENPSDQPCWAKRPSYRERPPRD